MTYNAVEISDEGRQPIELYTFQRDFQTFRYTSADRTVTYGGADFTAAVLSRSAVESTVEVARSAIKITAPRDLGVVDLFRISPPSVPVTFTLQQYHYGDNAAVVVWTGRISSVSWSGATAEITLDPIYSSLRRAGLRRMYQAQCPHVLYGAQCKVNREAYRTEGTVDAFSSSTVTVNAADALEDGYFAGGILEYSVELGLIERRFITNHTGANLTLSARPAGMALLQLVKLYPGCNHTVTACSSKFSNVLNYGGMPYFADKNPFGGSPIF